MPTQNTAMGHQLVRTIKLVQAVRAQAPARHAGIDHSTYAVLFAVESDPIRLSDVAARTHTEISTVSRQVTALADHGLIEKVPDPRDGRAQLLSLTPAGRETLTRLRAGRDAWLASLMQGWSAQDIEAFSTYLARFADAVEAGLRCPTTDTGKDPA